MTEVNKFDHNYRRLLCLKCIDNQLIRVPYEKDFSKHCGHKCDKKICSPVVVTSSNGASYYSQGYYNEIFHIVKIPKPDSNMETEKLLN